MIKRIIACLTICLIITGLICPVISHAEPVPIYTPNWSDPGIAEIIDISDLTGWMANGGVFDITDFQDVEEFLSWYFKIRVPMKDENGEIYFAPYYGYDYSLSVPDPDYDFKFNKQSQVRGMIKRSYQNKTGYGRRFQEQVDKALLEDGDLSNVNIPLMDASEAAFFVGYDVNALNAYTNQFVSIPETVNPDPNYLTYIDHINGNSFNFIKDLPNILVSNGMPNFSSAPYTVSWYNGQTPSYNNVQNYAWTKDNFVGPGSPLRTSYNNTIDDVEIYSINNVYTVTLNCPASGPNMDYYFLIPGYNGTDGHRQNIGYFLSSGNNWLTGGGTHTYPNNNWETQTFSSESLAEVFEWLEKWVKNVNIYVNAEPWALINNNVQPDIAPEFPDTVGGDELPVTTWPLTVPKAPSYINLPGLRQAFQRAKNTDNQFDILDLRDSLVDPEGDPIEDPDFETMPVPIPNPDPINPTVVPELPNLPLIPPAYNPGFTGVSVLAEIINFTNQSLPSGLIVVFWGIIFGVVILGIIKILHK